MKTLSLAFAALLALAVPASAATLTVTNLGDGQAAYDLVDPFNGTALQSGVSFDAAIVANNVGGVYRSPYDNSGSASVPGWQQLSYFAVGPANLPSPATLLIAGGADMLKFLWGSIDGYNGLEFFSGATSLGVVTNADIAPASTEPAGKGASYVTISSDMDFDRVMFISSRNAFEVANITVFLDDQPPGGVVPVPAAGLLLIGAMGGLALMRRRA